MHRSRAACGAISVAICLLTGCSTLKAVGARMEPRDRFLPTRSSQPVLAEAGSEEMAQRLALALPDAIAKAEAAHRKPFLEPPRIYACSAECFAIFTAMSASVPAGHFMDSVFMNVPVLTQRERTHGVLPEQFLLHELAHLLLYQHAGGAGYMSIPAWFREGFATHLSGGAGSERCPPQEAIRHLLNGQTIDPRESGSLFNNRTAASYGISSPVFYRQGEMFVAFLQRMNEAAFEAALKAILERSGFQSSFREAYGKPLPALWNEFLDSLRATSQ